MVAHHSTRGGTEQFTISFWKVDWGGRNILFNLICQWKAPIAGSTRRQWLIFHKDQEIHNVCFWYFISTKVINLKGRFTFALKVGHPFNLYGSIQVWVSCVAAEKVGMYLLRGYTRKDNMRLPNLSLTLNRLLGYRRL